MADLQVPLTPLPRDLRKASSSLGRDEARFLVDLFYAMQDERIGLKNQARALQSVEEPHDTVAFFGEQFQALEGQIKASLDAYSAADPLGQWARAQIGIGPIIAAGLLAHIDLSNPEDNTVGKIWRFAGLDPTVKWEKGQKRPFNAKLKVLCWKIGESFVKFSGNEKCFYGKLYRQRKEYEVNRNEAVWHVEGSAVHSTHGNGDHYVIRDGETLSCFDINGLWFAGGNAKWAAETLRTRKIKDAETLAVYRQGKLPAGRIDQRSRRWAVKLFLSHYFMVGYEMQHGVKPPLPFAVSHMLHKDLIPPPAGA